MNKALKRMDVCDWVPEKPVKMLYCRADDQVTYRNAVYTDSLMNSKGAPNVSSKDVFSTGNHGTCILPAIREMLAFFGEFQQIKTLAVQNHNAEDIEIFPNPVDDYIHIKGGNGGKTTARIYDIVGNLLNYNLQNINNKINVSDLSQGVYFVVIENGGTKVIKKIVK